MKVWRLVPEKFAEKVFSGEGSRRFSGRWHYAGCEIVYTSSSLSLALLEFLVNLDISVMPACVKVSATIPDSIKVEKAVTGKLPADWRFLMDSPELRNIGMDWLERKKSAVLEVPSAVVPEESNFILNLNHPDFRKIKLGKPEKFVLDRRLFK